MLTEPGGLERHDPEHGLHEHVGTNGNLLPSVYRFHGSFLTIRQIADSSR